jgi:hypothetical protein
LDRALRAFCIAARLTRFAQRAVGLPLDTLQIEGKPVQRLFQLLHA